MNSSALDKWLSQLRKGSLEMVVLASLRDEKLYGLEILRRLAALEVVEGTLYPLLNRLRKDGYLESEWETRDSGHPRRYYRLTRAGRVRAIEMAKRWTTYNRELRELMQPLIEEG
ncbi:MAG: helix-turn-helix transcriptional regulator [bacterium]|nr:helix-turn-helix transcriptional regulator [bacterium]